MTAVCGAGSVVAAEVVMSGSGSGVGAVADYPFLNKPFRRAELIACLAQVQASRWLS